jgi:ethanolamine utilization protein EutA (predicted chaperonin)
LQKRIDRNNRRIVYILRKVDELIQQVELENRQARSILHANFVVLMAEDMAADADHILLEAMTLSVKADKLKKASEVAGEQVDKLSVKTQFEHGLNVFYFIMNLQKWNL